MMFVYNKLVIMPLHARNFILQTLGTAFTICIKINTFVVIKVIFCFQVFPNFHYFIVFKKIPNMTNYFLWEIMIANYVTISLCFKVNSSYFNGISAQVNILHITECCSDPSRTLIPVISLFALFGFHPEISKHLHNLCLEIFHY